MAISIKKNHLTAEHPSTQLRASAVFAELNKGISALFAHCAVNFIGGFTQNPLYCKD